MVSAFLEPLALLAAAMALGLVSGKSILKYLDSDLAPEEDWEASASGDGLSLIRLGSVTELTRGPPPPTMSPRIVRPPSKAPGANLVRRLLKETRAQGRRAHLNLVLGVVMALSALGVFAWQLARASVAPSTPHFSELYWGALAITLAMACTASVFAFFFLSTYRRSMSEIRYFQNELTNIQALQMALDLCAGEDGTAARLEILKTIAATERNFILRKGETTTDLAQKDLDRAETSALTRTLEAVFKNGKPPTRKP